MEKQKYARFKDGISDSIDTLKDRPFLDLKRRLDSMDKKRADQVLKDSSRLSEKEGDEDGETLLFLKAMKGVRPLNKDRGPNLVANRATGSRSHVDGESQDALRQLKELVEGARPIPVNQTPEYVQGPDNTGENELALRLHSGAFAIQAYCELHGMDSLTALERCETFTRRAIMEGKRCVAFIHGRGLSSKNTPVLKELVRNWLKRGTFRRYVVAFSSAPIWDGGAGVTYVMFRSRPAKRQRVKGLRHRLWDRDGI